MLIRIILISITLSLTSCISYDFSKRTVQQGNILSPKRVDKLHLGMSKNDVAILMGTSLVSPDFNNDRWDYAYTYRKSGKLLVVRHLVLYFKGDRLIQIDRKP